MAVTKRTRYEVLRRDNHTCRYCGGRAPDVVLTIDHVTPLALGGSNDPSNLVAACKDCNAGKSSTGPDAPLVAGVSDDALRWASAMKAAVEQEMLAYGQREQYREKFRLAWKARDPRLTLLDPGWAPSLTRWCDLGVPIELVLEALSLAWGNDKVSETTIFRYMAGIVWKKIYAMQDATTAAASGSAAHGVRCGHCNSCQITAADHLDYWECETLPGGEPADPENATACPHCDSSTCVYVHGFNDGDTKGWQDGYARAEARHLEAIVADDLLKLVIDGPPPQRVPF